MTADFLDMYGRLNWEQRFSKFNYFFDHFEQAIDTSSARVAKWRLGLQYVDGLYTDLIRKTRDLDQITKEEGKIAAYLEVEIEDLESFIGVGRPKPEQLVELAERWWEDHERN